MNGVNDINTQNNARGLLPYPIIIAANVGEAEAMNVILKHYDSYISSLSVRRIQDEYGNSYWGIDQEMQDCLQSKLIHSVLAFEI